jgi:hypothetical protein
MGARQDFTKAQAEITRQKALLAKGQRSGNQTLISATKANIRVLEGRATTAFQKIAREAAVKAQARQRAQAQAQQIAQAKQAKREAQERQAQQQVVQIPVPTAPAPAPARLSSRQRALQIRQAADAARKEKADFDAAKKAEELRSRDIFESERIQSQAPQSFETGEAFRISELEKRREAAVEKVEATKSLERLEAGTTVFETGAGFNPVALESGEGQKFSRSKDGVDLAGTIFSVKEGKVSERPAKDVLPGEPEGLFISGQVQSQLVDNIDDVLTIDKQIGAIKTEIPGTPEFSRGDPDDPSGRGGVAALDVFKQTKGIEATPDLFPDRTIVATGEELGVAVKTKEKFFGETFVFPALKGDLIAEVESPTDIAERTGGDPFVIAQDLREQTGLKPGEPVSFGSLLGQDIPVKAIQPTVSKSKTQDPLLSLQAQGQPQTLPPFAGSLESIFGSQQPISQPKLPKRGKSSVFLSPTSAGFIAAPAVTQSNFDSFLSNLGSTFNISSDLFSTVSSGLDFGNIFGTKKLPQRRQTASQKKASSKAKAAGQIATLQRQGRAVPSSLIAQAFPDKSARAKAAGFQVSSSGQIFEGRRSKGTFTGLKGSSVAQVKSKRAEIIRIAAEKARKAKEKAQRIAAEKRARVIRKRQKKGRSKGARAPSSQVSIFGGGSSSFGVPTVSVSGGAGQRGRQKSQDFIGGIGTSPGTQRARGPSSSGGVFNIPVVKLAKPPKKRKAKRGSVFG